MMKKTVFKIQATEGRNAGLFSTGGERPSWNEHGKIWTTLGYVKTHLTPRGMEHYKSCCAVVVELVIEETQKGDPIYATDLWQVRLDDANAKRLKALNISIEKRRLREIEERDRLNRIYPKDTDGKTTT